MNAPDDPPTPDDARARLRAADADRELVHRILSAAMERGSLTLGEYEERAGKAVAAKTFGDLDALTDDLPVGQLGVPMPFVGATTVTHIHSSADRRPVQHKFALMSGTELRGHATVGDGLTATAVMGGIDIDLREVEFTAPMLTIRCTALMGGIDITVPPDVGVDVDGWAVMGGFGGRAAGPGTPGAPTVRVVGLALMGAVEVKRKDREPRR
ncbi:DUF1707 domain-containing protein [Gordonia sp. Z-3]|uniref:DUF1707 domain-containing protein n=1 Tax=Gordonia aquimaris TaxID=2984863 RepID=A0A9X3D0Z7_9ACTN|nr:MULTISPECIES: DUF1707 domain-containing protein [Gordonia]MAU82472.1 hypothetical protein [Gordonia sp. (in: high G+C Gram-positive bacteria)]MCX2962762.1 DUF1707 domain-containing protein [Gordonia aquimaris]MED5799906.1 DUF1707 domain-containing protein [Gordonia sp. Z-3]